LFFFKGVQWNSPEMGGAPNFTVMLTFVSVLGVAKVLGLKILFFTFSLDGFQVSKVCIKLQ
jgi:hypothetical protein